MENLKTENLKRIFEKLNFKYRLTAQTFLLCFNIENNNIDFKIEEIEKLNADDRIVLISHIIDSTDTSNMSKERVALLNHFRKEVENLYSIENK